MSTPHTPRQLGVAAARPFIRAAADTLPDDLVLAVEIGPMVDAVIHAVHPDAVTPPRHRPEEEDDLAYRVGETTTERPPLYAFISTWPGGHIPRRTPDAQPGRPRVDITIVEAETATTARIDTREVLTLSGDPANLRLFALGLIAAIDHATVEHARALDSTDTEK